MNISLIAYICGLIGMWDFLDGLGSIYSYKDKEGWVEHSFRVLRMLRGVVLIVLGGLLLWN